MPEKRAADDSAELTTPSTTTMEHSGVTAWYFTTIAAYVPTTALKNLFSLPFRAADRFLQPQSIRVETIIREDGAHKKRLIHAGAGGPAMPIRTGSPRPSSPRSAAASPQPGSPPRPKAKPGSRWRARATAAASAEIVQHASPMQAHMLRALQARPPPASWKFDDAPSLSVEDQIWSPTPAYPTRSTHAYAESPKAPSQNHGNTTYASTSLLRKRRKVAEVASPASSPSIIIDTRPGKHVRFANYDQVKMFSNPYAIQEIDIYEDTSVTDVVNDYIAKQKDLMRRAARAMLEDTPEVDGDSSESKEDIGTPPRLPSPVRELLPSQQMIRELLELEEQYTMLPEDSDREDSFSELKGVRSNTLANGSRQHHAMHDVDGPSMECKDFVHDESSSEFKDFAGDGSSSEFKELLSSPIRPSTPIEQSMRYLQLAQELFDDDLIIASTPQPSTPAEDILIPAPPPALNITPLVAPLTTFESDNLNKVAQENATNDNAIIVELPTMELNTHDFGTLLPTMFKGHANGWLNDNIINEYLDLLVGHVKEKQNYVHVRGKNGVAPPVHAFKSQWYTSMKKSPTSTARWARPANLSEKKLLDCSLVLIPICDGSHWRLIAMKPKERIIEYYDSLHNKGTVYTTAALDWVKLVLKEHYVSSEWSVSEHQKSEEQVNARDCGVFTVLNALVLLRGEEHSRVIVSNGMQDARLRIAATLLAKKPTTELD